MRQTRAVRIEVYVDGSGGDNPGYAWVCPQTGEESFVSMSTHTNNETEYLAIISALRHFGADHGEVVVYSDSRLVVSQIRGAYKTKEARMLRLKREAMRAKQPGHEIRWIPRTLNVAGRRLEPHTFERRPASRIDEHETTKRELHT